MNSHDQKLFAILGGGIAGLTTAIALKQMGITATVYEAAPEFKPLGAGIMLAKNAMKVYKKLGLYDRLYHAGQPFDQFTFYSRKGNPISRTLASRIEPMLANVAIHRAILHEVLLSYLEPSQIVVGKRSQGFSETAEGYEVSFTDGTTLQAKYLIVAEGIHSPIRQQVLPTAKKRYSGYTCWRGVASIAGPLGTEAFETWGGNGRFGAVPLKENTVYWFAVKNAPEDSDEMKRYGLPDLKKIFRGYHDPIGKILDATPADQILHNDLHDLCPISQYAYGNLVLIGDAAHATTPNMGQGACQAIEDALVLANCLKRNSQVRDAFKAFEEQRLKRTHAIVEQSRRAGKLAQLENPVAIGLRNFVLRAIPSSFYEKQLKKLYDFQPGAH